LAFFFFLYVLATEIFSFFFGFLLSKNEVVKRFPESKYKCVGGFVFLRFFCPVIIAPESFGVVDEAVDKRYRRPLTLVCKVLQNLSNNVRFGKVGRHLFRQLMFSLFFFSIFSYQSASEGGVHAASERFHRRQFGPNERVL
jgi:hypothetical protein